MGLPLFHLILSLPPPQTTTRQHHLRQLQCNIVYQDPFVIINPPLKRTLHKNTKIELQFSNIDLFCRLHSVWKYIDYDKYSTFLNSPHSSPLFKCQKLFKVMSSRDWVCCQQKSRASRCQLSGHTWLRNKRGTTRPPEIIEISVGCDLANRDIRQRCSVICSN